MNNSEHMSVTEFRPETVGRFIGKKVIVTITRPGVGDDQTQLVKSAVGTLAGAQRSNWSESSGAGGSLPALWFESQREPFTIPIGMSDATVNIFFLHQPSSGGLEAWAGRD